MARTCLVLLLLASSILSVSAFGDDVFIDCGGSTVFTDEINSAVWMGDSDFVGMTGESKVVQTPRGVSTALTTLRVFPTRSKNCYNLIDFFTKGTRVLVRASFYYGNYDKKSAPPTFDVLFDANHWDTVETSLDEVVYTEVSYVTMTNNINICVAQTKHGQFPFMSALEIRELDTKMYNLLDSSYALLTKERIAYGATEIIRYSDDDYDRMWSPAKIGTGLTVAQNEAEAVDMDVSPSSDDPPKAVLMNAITTTSTAQTIKLSSNFPAQETPIYVNMYFSELTDTQNRSFEVYIDDKVLDTIVPIYESVVELSIFNTTATTNTSFTLQAATGSTLPPLINAMEVFYVSGPLSDGTDINDVNGLAALQKGFEGTILDEWSGDPCLPSPYSWEWVNCTSEVVPRITALNLANYGLTGDLSQDFDSMDALEIIDLHDNKITGPIPDFLGTLPNLKVLNLANNDFSGPIPASISSNKKIKLQTSGNKLLCDTGKSCTTFTGTTAGGELPGSGDSSGKGGGVRSGGGGGRGKKKSKTPVIVGTTVPAFLAFWAFIGYFVVSRNKRKRAAVAAAGAAGRPNGPNGTPAHERQHNPLMDKFGNAAVNEIKVNMRDEHTNNAHQENTNGHENNHHQDDRDTD